MCMFDTTIFLALPLVFFVTSLHHLSSFALTAVSLCLLGRADRSAGGAMAGKPISTNWPVCYSGKANWLNFSCISSSASINPRHPLNTQPASELMLQIMSHLPCHYSRQAGWRKWAALPLLHHQTCPLYPTNPETMQCSEKQLWRTAQRGAGNAGRRA